LNESAEYFKARNALLVDGLKLRRQIETVAEQRRSWDDTMFKVFRLEDGLDHRSGDATSALWWLLDMTPEGRGRFMARLQY
jgi:predicted dithiol-disulfide oxidoreductase (DUF899 family)